jgi:hypothetical protein
VQAVFSGLQGSGTQLALAFPHLAFFEKIGHRPAATCMPHARIRERRRKQDVVRLVEPDRTRL